MESPDVADDGSTIPTFTTWKAGHELHQRWGDGQPYHPACHGPDPGRTVFTLPPACHAPPPQELLGGAGS